MTPRQHHGSDSRLESGLLIALIVGLPFTVLIPRIAILVGAIGLITVLALSFNELARTDRSAFLSIAIPVGTVAFLGFALPFRLAVALDEAAAIFLGLFALAPGSFVPLWWRVILRRPRVAFALRFASQIRQVSRLTTEVSAGKDRGGRALALVEEQIARLRSLSTPDADWTQLRNDYANELELILDLASRSASAQAYRDETIQAEALRARFDELVARGG